MKRPAHLLLAATLALAGCGAANTMIRTPGCRPLDRVPDFVALQIGRVTDLPQMCPRMVEGSIRGPVRLTATREGLHVQFGVVVASYSPGPYRDDGLERDAVVVFPADTGPGQPSHQLTTVATPGGYVVDDVVPWAVWGLEGPAGTFRLTIAIFDNYEGGRVETRVTATVVLPPAD